MIDIKHKKCKICEIKRPSFNYDKEIFALYCQDCKLENMIDIINKTLQPRLNKLKEVINNSIDLVPDTNITTIKLFYDGY